MFSKVSTSALCATLFFLATASAYADETVNSPVQPVMPNEVDLVQHDASSATPTTRVAPIDEKRAALEEEGKLWMKERGQKDFAKWQAERARQAVPSVQVTVNSEPQNSAEILLKAEGELWMKERGQKDFAKWQSERAWRALPKKNVWYGWQTLAVDAASIGLMTTGDLSILGLGGFVLSPAIVHIANDPNHSKALLGFGLRMGGIVTGAALLSAGCSASGSDPEGLGCGLSAAWGAALGYTASTIIDVGFNSTKTVVVESEKQAPQNLVSMLSLSPTFEQTKGGYVGGVSGRF